MAQESSFGDVHEGPGFGVRVRERRGTESRQTSFEVLVFVEENDVVGHDYTMVRRVLFDSGFVLRDVASRGLRPSRPSGCLSPADGGVHFPLDYAIDQIELCAIDERLVAASPAPQQARGFGQSL